MFQTQKLISVIKPLIFFSNFLFFFMFHIRSNGIFVSKKMTVLAFAFLFFCVIYKRLLSVRYSFFAFAQVVLNVSDISFVLFVIFSHLNFFIHRESIVKTWNSIIKYADFVTDDSYYKKAFRVVFVQVAVFNSVIFIHIASYCYFNPKLSLIQHILDTIINHCLLTHFCGTIFLFSNSLHFARKIMSLANEELRTLRRVEHFKDIPSVSGLAFVKVKRIARMKSTMKFMENENLFSLFEVYEKVCELCLDLNELFGISLAMTCLHNQLEMVLTSYFMTVYSLASLPIFTFWLLFFFGMNWVLLNACEKFTAETRKTRLLLNSVITENSSSALKEAVQRFSLHLLHQRVKFTACSLFSLDYKLLYSTFTSLITYLVIFVQFDRK